MAQHDRRRAHQARLERRPEGVVRIVAVRELSEPVHLGVCQIGRAQPAWRRLSIDDAIPAGGDNRARLVGERRANTDVA
jgi:hypothetical protein